MTNYVCRFMILIMAFGAIVLPSAGQGSAFTYQGRLTDRNVVANGDYDMTFVLFNAAANGARVGGPQSIAPVKVADGLFTVTIDFGAAAFDGGLRWLEIGVRTNGSTDAYRTLVPRQAVLASPYAIHAISADALVGNSTVSGTITFSPNAGPPFVVVSSLKVPNLNADLLDGLDSTAFALKNVCDTNCYWRLLGNSGTTAGPNFLGTSDNQPLELAVNSQRALRLEPVTDSPNLIGGFSGNSVSPGVAGAFIGGGGFGALPNLVSTNYGSVVGGRGNTASAIGATVAGGTRNFASGGDSFVGSGSENGASGSRSTVSGGERNHASGTTSTVAGGYANSATAFRSTVSGGELNSAGGPAAVVCGGDNNSASGYASVISGGEFNIANGNYATVIGGLRNFATNYAVTAGRQAKATNQGAFVFADSQFTDFYSTADDQASFRFQGGFRVTSGTAGANQTVAWTPGSGSWTFSSDRNLKEKLTPVDAKTILEKVAQLSISEWNYKGYPQRHVGPMAQDFHALFPLNDSDTTLNSLDLDGVALAAIQGLNQELKDQRAALTAKDAKIAALQESVTELKNLVELLLKQQAQEKH